VLAEKGGGGSTPAGYPLWSKEFINYAYMLTGGKKVEVGGRKAREVKKESASGLVGVCGRLPGASGNPRNAAKRVR